MAKRLGYKAMVLTDDFDMSLGKLQPQDQDAEAAILGALLLETESGAIHTVMEILTSPDNFYKDAHQIIYKSLVDMYKDQKKIDIVTMTNHLRTIGKLEYVGGAYYISHLISNIHSAANIETHCRIILEHYFRRVIIKYNTTAVGDAYEDTIDIFDIIDKEYKKLNYISEYLTGTSFTETRKLLKETIDYLETIKDTPGHVTGKDTGFFALNKITSGIQDEYLVFAARPGMGKTALAVSMALTMAKNGEDVAFFSLEMARRQLMLRLISMEAEIDLEKLRGGNYSKEEFERIIIKTAGLAKLNNLVIHDEAGLNILALRAKCHRQKREQGLSIVFVDYLQLMSGDGGEKNREQEISRISRGLKALTKELGVPVVALSQLSRAVEARPNKKPQLADLRESGSIEQDADVVCFLYRPEYYGQTETESGGSAAGYAELIIAKNRQGKTGGCPLKWIGKFTKFADYASEMTVSDFNKEMHEDYKSKSVDPEDYKDDKTLTIAKNDDTKTKEDDPPPF